MTLFIDLVVTDGADKGMRYTIEAGTYRVIGRSGDQSDSTIHLTQDGDRYLDADQQALVEEMFQSRASRGLRTRFRRRGSDVLIDDTSVSRTHAVVFADTEGVSVADLMSTNGTKVNGTPIHDMDLQEGDVIQIGKTRFAISTTHENQS